MKRARCQRFGAAARREEGEYPLWIFDRRATQKTARPFHIYEVGS